MLSPDPAQSEQAPSMQTGFKKSQEDNENNTGQRNEQNRRKSVEPTNRSYKKSFPGSDLNDRDEQSRP